MARSAASPPPRPRSGRGVLGWLLLALVVPLAAQRHHPEHRPPTVPAPPHRTRSLWWWAVPLGILAAGLSVGTIVAWPGPIGSTDRMPTGGLILLTDQGFDITGSVSVELTRTADPTTDDLRVRIALSGMEMPAITVTPDLTLATSGPVPHWHLLASGDFEPVRTTNPQRDLCRSQPAVRRRGGRVIECRDVRRFAPEPFRVPDLLASDYRFEFGRTFGTIPFDPDELATVDLDDPTRLDDPFGYGHTRRTSLLATSPGYDAERAAVISGAVSPIAVGEDGRFDTTIVFRIRELPTADTTASSRTFRLPPIGDAYDVRLPGYFGRRASGPASAPSENCWECAFTVTSAAVRVGPPELVSKHVTVTDLARPGERLSWSAPEPTQANTLEWREGLDEDAFDLLAAEPDAGTDTSTDPETTDPQTTDPEPTDAEPTEAELASIDAAPGQTLGTVEFELSDPGAGTLASSRGFLAGALASGAVGLVVLLLQKALERLEARPSRRSRSPAAP